MIPNYKPFLIQKLADGSPIRDSSEWNIYVKSIPFKVFPDMKDVPSYSWSDRNGDDEFIPDTPFFKAYEMECEFVFIGNEGTGNTSIRSFLGYLANNGMFKFYDTHSKIGRTKARYVSFNDDVLYRKSGQKDIIVFTVTIKVNDPITDIELYKQ